MMVKNSGLKYFSVKLIELVFQEFFTKMTKAQQKSSRQPQNGFEIRRHK